MIIWISRWWNARRRRIDLEILWPACKAQAVDLDHAKAAFAVHAYADSAWADLGKQDIYDFIDGLE
jgi:hypothetical protein